MRRARISMRCATIGAVLLAAMYVPAQDGGEATNRIDIIMSYVEERAAAETDAVFDRGEFPKATQNLRFRNRVLPNYELVGSELVWMLFNVQYYDEMLATARTFRLDNPKNPDAGMMEAEFYLQKRAYFRIPPILEPSLTVGATPHPNTFRVLGIAYSRMGYHADSARVWEMLLLIAPDDEKVKLNLRTERALTRRK